MCKECENQADREAQQTLPGLGLPPVVPVVPSPAECVECGDSEASVQNADGNDYCESCYDDNYTHCADCSVEVSRRDCRTSDDGDDFCRECYDAAFTNCERCNNEVALDDSHSPIVGRYRGDCLCNSCYENYYDRCADCGEEVYCDDAYSNHRDEHICEGCYDNYSSCEDCGRIVPNDDIICRNDGYYCQRCAPDEGCNSHAFRPSQSTYDKVGSKRRFGVELETSECNGFEDLDGATVFSAKEDGSIDGMEFVSEVLHGDAGLNAIDGFCREANFKGFAVDAKCGFHAHFGVGDLSDDQLRSVACAYAASANVWTAFVSKARRDNDYCGALSWDCDDIERCDSIRDFAYGIDRYQWLNLKSYNAHRTFEVRLHSSTLNGIKVCNWIKAHVRFIDYVSKMTVAQVRERFEGKSAQANFEALADIWADAELTEFYRQRANKFGARLAAPATREPQPALVA